MSIQQRVPDGWTDDALDAEFGSVAVLPLRITKKIWAMSTAAGRPDLFDRIAGADHRSWESGDPVA